MNKSARMDTFSTRLTMSGGGRQQKKDSEDGSDDTEINLICLRLKRQVRMILDGGELLAFEGKVLHGTEAP